MSSLTDRDPPGNPVIPFTLDDRLRLQRLETKMNLVSWLAGASFITVLSLVVSLLLGGRV